LTKGAGPKEITYAEAGVDIERTDSFVEQIRERATRTRRGEVVADIGPFAGAFRVPKGYRNPVLVSSADGVGTKVKLAALLQSYRSVGIDLVNHCVNDLLTRGAQPLFFFDYIGSAALRDEARIEIIDGIVEACRECNCSLLGGETADMPQVYGEGDFDLVGFIVGIVEEEEIIDGSLVAEGDALIGLESNGLHTNGYSLVRSIFGVGMGSNDLESERERLNRSYSELGGQKLGEALLATHKSYYAELKPRLQSIKGICHITGSGIMGGSISANIARILPSDLQAQLNPVQWPLQQIFSLIKERGNVSSDEMYRTFNMGLGMVLVVDAEHKSSMISELQGAYDVGSIVRRPDGEGPVRLIGSHFE
jgi:phosphoribosylformylglycinamidine cyclo-ligase